MKIEVGKDYRTGAGLKAFVAAYNPEAPPARCMIGWIGPDLVYWNEEGKFPFPHTQFDLVAEWHEPRSGEFWVNVYPTGASLPRESREQADEGATTTRIACVRIPWTEGDGLDPPKPADDGWIEWMGGDRPAMSKTIVEIRCRDDSFDGPRRAEDFIWSHDGDVSDIMAYRVV